MLTKWKKSKTSKGYDEWSRWARLSGGRSVLVTVNKCLWSGQFAISTTLYRKKGDLLGDNVGFTRRKTQAEAKRLGTKLLKKLEKDYA